MLPVRPVHNNRIIRNPGKAEMEEYIRDGQRATWPAISYIKHLCALEHGLGAALLRLRRRVNEKYSKRARSRGSGRGHSANSSGSRSPRLTILSSSLQGMGASNGTGIALRLERTASHGNDEAKDADESGDANISPFTEHFLAADPSATPSSPSASTDAGNLAAPIMLVRKPPLEQGRGVVEDPGNSASSGRRPTSNSVSPEVLDERRLSLFYDRHRATCVSLFVRLVLSESIVSL